MNFLFSIVFPFLIVIIGAFLCSFLWNKKHAEIYLAVSFLVLVLLDGFAFSQRLLFWKEAARNMEAAFIQSAARIKGGEQQLLQRKIAALLETREFESASAYRVSAAFRKAVDDSFPSDDRTSRRLCIQCEIIASAVGVLFLLIWGILLLAKGKPLYRKTFLVVIWGLAAWGLLMISVPTGVINGYGVTFFRMDIKSLARELEKEEFSPAMLKLMEEPQRDSYSYFRSLPALEEKMGLKHQ